MYFAIVQTKDGWIWRLFSKTHRRLAESSAVYSSRWNAETAAKSIVKGLNQNGPYTFQVYRFS